MNKLILSQIVGVVAIVLNISSLQMKKKTSMMKMFLAANVLFILQYFLLGAYSAASTNIITVIRIILYDKYDEKRKKIPKKLVVFLLSLCLVALLITYSGPLSLIPIILTMTYVVAATLKDTRKFKIIFGCCGIVWIFFNASVKAYVNIVGNVLEVISSFVGAKRSYKRKKSKH